MKMCKKIFIAGITILTTILIILGADYLSSEKAKADNGNSNTAYNAAIKSKEREGGIDRKVREKDFKLAAVNQEISRLNTAAAQQVENAIPVFARGDYTRCHSRVGAEVRGWGSIFKHNGAKFNAVRFTCIVAAPAMLEVEIVTADAQTILAHGKVHASGGNSPETFCVGLNQTVQVASGTDLYIRYFTKDAAGVGASGGGTYESGDADPSVYPDKYCYFVNGKLKWFDAAGPYYRIHFDAFMLEEASKRRVPIVLPPKLYAVAGRECNVYYDNLFFGRGADYETKLTTTAGTAQNERYTVIPSGSSAGNAFKVEVFDPSDWKKLAGAESTLYIAGANAGSGQTVKATFIGDSLTQAGVITQTLLDISASDVMHISLIGIRGRSDTNRHEGRGGWTVATYISAGPSDYEFTVSGVTTVPAINAACYSYGGSIFRVQEVYMSGGAGTIVCTLESGPAPSGSGTLVKTTEAAGDNTIAFSSVAAVPGNPFWINGALSYSGYLSKYSLDTPDWAFIMLGTNDVMSCTSDAAAASKCTSVFADLDTLIASIKSAGVSKIGLMIIPPPSADQDSAGANYGSNISRARVKRNYLIWAEKLIAKYKDSESSGVYLVPVNTAIDCVHNFPKAAATPVNSRSSVTVQRASNCVHPDLGGYQQIGDAVWAFLKCKAN